MGCGISKPKQCPHCRRPISPVRRSRSMQHHSSPQHNNDTHGIALTKSFNLSLINENDNEEEDFRTNDYLHESLIEAKLWSSLIEDKLPKIAAKTPITTPPGEPETINVWEIMEGLEERMSPIHISCDHDHDHLHISKLKVNQTFLSINPMWVQTEEDTSMEIDMSLDLGFEHVEFDTDSSPSRNNLVFEFGSDSDFKNLDLDLELSDDSGLNPNKKNIELDSKVKVIVYFTSLRGIRKTYEDCEYTRVILKGLGLNVDERDVSMDSGFKDELRGKIAVGESISLPRVFIGSNCIGGVEEIKRLNEEGKLEKMFEDCEMMGGGDRECVGCGDVRFVPCDTCFGSRKTFHEYEEDDEENDEDDEEENDEYEEEDVEEKDDEFGFRRCPDCNENGLIRCPICCE